MSAVEELEQFAAGMDVPTTASPVMRGRNIRNSMMEYEGYGKLVAMRGQAALAGEELRERQSQTDKANTDADVFDQFSEGLKGVDVTDPEAVSKYTQEAIARDPRAASVKEVQDFMEGMGKAGSLRLGAKKDKLQGMALDEEESQWEVTRDLSRKQQKLALAQTDAEMTKIGDTLEEGKNVTLGGLQEQLGASELNEPVKEQIAKLAGAFSSESDLPKLKQLGALVSAANSFGHFESAMKHESGGHGQILKFINDRGLSNANEDQIIKVLGKGSQKHADYELAKASGEKLRVASEARKRITEYIPGALQRIEAARKSGDTDAFNGEMSALGMKVFGFKGFIDKNLREQKAAFDTQEEQLKLAKTAQEISNAKSAEERRIAIEKAKPFIRSEQEASRYVNTMLNRGQIKRDEKDTDEQFNERILKIKKQLTGHLGKGGSTDPAAGL